jgi:hypothetical protein
LAFIIKIQIIYLEFLAKKRIDSHADKKEIMVTVIGYGREERVKFLATGIFCRRTQTASVIHAVFYTNLGAFYKG